MKYFVYLAVTLLIYACTEKMDMQTPPVKPVLVVNSLITPDSMFSCRVGQIVALDDQGDNAVTNATIEITETETGKPVASLQHVNNGYYRAMDQARPSPNTSYSIHVSAPGFDYPASATTKVPDKVYPDTAYQIFDAGKEVMGPNISEAFSKIVFTISDNKKETNYYEAIYSEITVYTKMMDPYTEGFVNDTTKEIIDYDFAEYSCNDPVILKENILSSSPDYLIFSDELFNGNTHEFTIRSGIISVNGVFTIITGSKEYYRYRKRWYRHRESVGVNELNQHDDRSITSLIQKPLPVKMYSNVKNGYGIFAGYNQTFLFNKPIYGLNSKINFFPRAGSFNREDYGVPHYEGFFEWSDYKCLLEYEKNIPELSRDEIEDFIYIMENRNKPVIPYYLKKAIPVDTILKRREIVDEIIGMD